jgi:hypothetical protein
MDRSVIADCVLRQASVHIRSILMRRVLWNILLKVMPFFSPSNTARGREWNINALVP